MTIPFVGAIAASPHAICTSTSMSRSRSYTKSSRLLVLLLLLVFPSQILAAFVKFSNCLEPSYQASNRLQFVPLFADAVFDSTDPASNLSVTVYGNVTGHRLGEQPPDLPLADPNNTFGKITNITDNITTLMTQFSFLTYIPYRAEPAIFCNATAGESCPWGPILGKNASNPADLYSFNVHHGLGSTYGFFTAVANMKVRSGDGNAALIACINVYATPPDHDKSLGAVFRWIPMVILALVGIATLLAAKLHPSSSKNFFYWSSNYGRDEDMIRLVTPGFGDCLQYIQFVVLTASLSLNYPGFYQPLISKAAWSTLTFNQSFVSHGSGHQSITDGVYTTNGTYGLSTLAQYVGMTTDADIWAGMAIWLLGIVGAVIVLCQLGFLINWIMRRFKESAPQDLRSKNLPFTTGSVTRIVYNYLLLPIVSLSIFQLVIAGKAPGWEVALALILLVAIAGFAVWTFYLIFSTNPRIHLFDHLPSLLVYGPLYNTYSDEAAPFAVVPVFLNIVRGIAIGAVQPSGIAQIVILAICEIIFVLTIHASHPFRGVTSMNAYHTFFSIIRFLTVILSVSYVPALDVDEGIKGWIGLVILLLHCIVMLFGFFLNSLQTLIEVFAHMAGLGERAGGVLRIFGVRQLKKRERRHDSLHSSTAMLEADLKAPHSHRLTSMSSGSYGRQSSFGRHSSFDRLSQALDGFSQADQISVKSGPSPGPSTPGMQSNSFTYLPANGDNQNAPFRRHSGSLAPPAPYYRPPRQRHSTLSTTNEDGDVEPQTPHARGPPVSVEAAGIPRRTSVMTNGRRDEMDAQTRKQTEYYSSREADYLYGVQRGPALSNSPPTRRRVSGPADPMSPVSIASGWVRSLFAGRKKDKSKGFEVVRSTPMQLLREVDEGDRSVILQEPYQDGPLTPPPRAETFGSSRAIPDSPSKAPRGLNSTEGSPTEKSSFLNAAPLTEKLNLDTASSSRGIDMEADAAYHPPTRSSTRKSSTDRGVDRSDSFQRTSYFDRDYNPDRRVPFDYLRTGKKSEGNSMTSSIYPPSEEIPEPSQYPRPRISGQYSTGQVYQKLASESIHTYTMHPAHLGSTAELVDLAKAEQAEQAEAAAPKSNT